MHCVNRYRLSDPNFIVNIDDIFICEVDPNQAQTFYAIIHSVLYRIEMVVECADNENNRRFTTNRSIDDLKEYLIKYSDDRLTYYCEGWVKRYGLGRHVTYIKLF